MGGIKRILLGVFLGSLTGYLLAAPVVLDLLTDNFGAETTFQMESVPGGVLFDPVPVPVYPLASSTNFIFTWDLPPGDYEFTIFDSFGDGICCGFGVGDYTLTTPTAVIPSPTGGAFGSSETIAFSIAATGEPTPVPTLSEWALILTSLALGGLALVGVGRSGLRA